VLAVGGAGWGRLTACDAAVVGKAVWNADAVRDDVRGYVVDTLADPAGVLILDDTGDLKKGIHTIGTQRQHTGTARRQEPPSHRPPGSGTGARAGSPPPYRAGRGTGCPPAPGPRATGTATGPGSRSRHPTTNPADIIGC
jgi:DDE superfamily endonuclease